MTQPFLSIVTISFNQARYLRECVDSVLAQKGRDVQYIVVDPGSTDGSREILQGYGDAIDVLLLEPDDGPADGLNKGFAKATGEIGYYINSDDFMLPGAVEHLRAIWAENKDMDVLLGGAWIVDARGTPTREMVSGPTQLRDLITKGTIVQQGSSFRMDRFREAGGFNTQNRTCWDYELICQILNDGAIARRTPARFGAFRLYDQSLSGGAHGAVHTKRYRQDMARIYHQNTGCDLKPETQATRCKLLLVRLLRHPNVYLSTLLDRVFPSRIRSRWERDLRQGATDARGSIE